jgi:hypothetical protein
MNRIICLVIGFLSPVLYLPAQVPRLVQFSSIATDVSGKPLAGTVGLTFYFYKEQQGGAPLWMEMQNVQPDKTGHYDVLLGSSNSQGLPADLFVAGEARWLGVQAQGQTEQPRIMLLSVPYALKAGDAETVGGLPASAFVLAAPSDAGQAAAAVTSTAGAAVGGRAKSLPPSTCDVTSDSKAGVNALAKFTTPCNVEASAISESSGSVGIGVAPAATTKLYVSDTQSNFGTAWGQRNVLNTAVTGNGAHYGLGLDVDATNATIATGVTDSGYRVAVRGLGYANSTGFGGTLTSQWGVVADAGINSAKSGAKVTNAFGGEFVILNNAPGTSITNAYGVYISNAGTAGTITNRYDLYASSANATSYFAGNVGIGTTTPAAKLEVNGGDVSVSTGNLDLPLSTSATQGVITMGGFPFIHACCSGELSTYVGISAGNFGGAFENTAIGAFALDKNTGNYNTATGYFALGNNNTGTSNVAVGDEALANVDASNNTAVGHSALGGLGLGGNNTAVGSAGGGSVIFEGSNNTFVGSNAGAVGNITINSSTAIGAGAVIGSFSTNLTNATAIGANAQVLANNALVLGSINGVNGATADTLVGVGTTAPTYKLHVGVINNGLRVEGPAAGGAGAVAVSFGGNGDFAIDKPGAAGGRFIVKDSTGNVGIGTAAPDELLSVNGSADKPGGGFWNSFSDGRLKTLNGSYTSGLSQVLKIHPVRYRYKLDNAMGIRDGDEHIGVVAQEVQRVIPEAVTENRKGYLLVNNDPIVWAMLNAIKEQQREIRDLKSELRATRQTLQKVKEQLGAPQPRLVATK